MQRMRTREVSEERSFKLKTGTDGAIYLDEPDNGASLPGFIKLFLNVTEAGKIDDTTWEDLKHEWNIVPDVEGRAVWSGTIEGKIQEPDPLWAGIKLDRNGYAANDDGESLTDPYGHLNWWIGNEDDGYCFDAALVKGDAGIFIVLHSVLDCDTGGFIQDGSYTMVPLEAAERTAEGFFDEAFTWLITNDIDYNVKETEKTQNDFLAHIRGLLLEASQGRV